MTLQWIIDAAGGAGAHESTSPPELDDLNFEFRRSIDHDDSRKAIYYDDSMEGILNDFYPYPSGNTKMLVCAKKYILRASSITKIFSAYLTPPPHHWRS